MNDAGRVRGHERLGDVARNSEGLVEWQRPAPESRRQRFAVDQFHDEIRRVDATDAGGADVVQRADPRMIELGDRACLALQPLAVVLIVKVARENFQGDITAKSRIACPVNLAHAAAANAPKDFERPEPLPGLQLSHGSQDRAARRRRAEKPFCHRVDLEQRPDFVVDGGVVRSCRHKGKTRLGRELERFLEQMPDAFPVSAVRHPAPRAHGTARSERVPSPGSP